jgi:hypothetical protein
MRNIVMQPQPMRLIRNDSSVNMSGMFVLKFSSKGLLSWSTIKKKIPWGKAISNPCGSDLSL